MLPDTNDLRPGERPFSNSKRSSLQELGIERRKGTNDRSQNTNEGPQYTNKGEEVKVQIQLQNINVQQSENSQTY